METALVLIHFGEPTQPDREAVTRYLTRIFLQNADLEANSDEEARTRAEELAERRAPGLLEEYEEIGGSPLNGQALEQGERLQNLLADRGYRIRLELAFQFVDPTIEDVLEELCEAGIDRVVTLPVYPLCGPSTTVASLERVDDVIAELDWAPETRHLSGWHRHPEYLRMRADNLRAYARAVDITPGESATSLLFSAHGIPQKYVEAGSRYVTYVVETCETVSRLAGFETYHLGFQNHANRDIPWTSPDVEDVIPTLDADRVLVEPMSFMHEQSETLAELDYDLAAEASRFDLAFHRVPVPHDHEAFGRVLADLVEPVLADVDPGMFQLRACSCARGDEVYCLNAPAR